MQYTLSPRRRKLLTALGKIPIQPAVRWVIEAGDIFSPRVSACPQYSFAPFWFGE